MIGVLGLLAPGCAGEMIDTSPDASIGLDEDAASSRPDARVADARVADARIADARTADARTADARTADAGATDAGATADAGNPTSCFTADGVTQVGQFSTIFYSETYAGATDQYVFNSNQCSDPPNSAERIFTFDLDTPTEWYTETRCGTSSTWDCELVLTRDGCTDADVVDCQTTIGNETMSGTLQPGQYALFVEGDNPEDPAVFDLMVNFNHTAGDPSCEATALDVLNPANCEDPVFGSPRYHYVLDDSTSPADVDDFFVDGVDGCTHDQNHVGGAPDRVYTLTLPAQRDVDLALTTPDWDALLYVTGSPCGARSAVVACSDDLIGSTEEISATLGAGTWYIVVDGFGEETFNGAAWGAFTLDVRVYDDACNQ